MHPVLMPWDLESLLATRLWPALCRGRSSHSAGGDVVRNWRSRGRINTTQLSTRALLCHRGLTGFCASALSDDSYLLIVICLRHSLFVSEAHICSSSGMRNVKPIRNSSLRDYLLLHGAFKASLRPMRVGPFF